MGTNVSRLRGESASALKKVLNADFKRRVYMEEEKAQQDNRFLKGRQIANIIHSPFEEWQRARLRHQVGLTKVPEEDTLEILYKKQPHHFEELKPLMALYLQNTVQKRDLASCFRLKELIRRHVEQNIISGSTDSFTARNEEKFLQGLRCNKAFNRPEFTQKTLKNA